MKIINLRMNHLEKPMGYAIDKIALSWIVEEATGTHQAYTRIIISMNNSFETILYDSGKRANISSLGFSPEIELARKTRYYWKVIVWADDKETAESESTWFETGLEGKWQGSWISSSFPQSIHPLFYKKFVIPQEIQFARLYITGLGAYQVSMNGTRVGDEILTPYFNDYNNWIQYQSYDITEHVAYGENAIGAMLGNSWYKGRFGFIDRLGELYGNEFLFLCEIHVLLKDGTWVIIGTDESWKCCPSPILESSIYDGEVYDSRKEIKDWATVTCDCSQFSNAVLAKTPVGKLQERLSPPVKVMERMAPAQLIETPAGETVIDFGQEVTGYVEFRCSVPEGISIQLQFGELLQHGNFYNENLRTAKQEHTYISNGKEVVVRPNFTFYGFRYVKVVGFETIKLTDFTACVVYSELERTGKIETSNEKVNRLFENTVWGQKGNFLDVPTDCPQRDERMGWTGDAQAFSATANYHMYTPAFFNKYLYDMLLEQRLQNGSVSYVVPDVLAQIMKITGQEEKIQHGSCAWGDAATVIPWNLYVFFGDLKLLASHYENMRLWVDYIKSQDEEFCGGSRLWKCGFHFADWLALDNLDKDSSFGGTDSYFVASAYYYYSALLTAKAANVLAKEEDSIYYLKLADEIKDAMRREYFTPTGRIAIDTQTAMVLSLHWGIVPEEYKERLVSDLKRKLEENKLHLNTGFVGTQFLCPVLSQNGLSEYAYTLLLNEDYPSWLYEVNMGATTIWERWNSVLPNGLVSDTGMNSMNHYAYGCISEWMYRYMCGIQPVESAPGFKKVVIAPQPDDRMEWVKASYQSASGKYESSWQHIDNHQIIFRVVIPFDAEAIFQIPEKYKLIRAKKEQDMDWTCEDVFLLTSGSYEIIIEKSITFNVSV